MQFYLFRRTIMHPGKKPETVADETEEKFSNLDLNFDDSSDEEDMFEESKEYDLSKNWEEFTDTQPAILRKTLKYITAELETSSAIALETELIKLLTKFKKVVIQ